MCKNMLPPDMLQITTSRMRFTCWITKATNTHSEYIIVTFFSNVTVVARTPLNVKL